MRRLSVLSLALAGLLLGCATKPTPSPPPPLQTVAPPSAVGVLPGLSVSREFAAPGDYLAPLPTAVVLLHPADASRNRTFCEGFVALSPTGSPGGFISSTVSTRWPLKVDTLTADQAANCEFLVQAYDVERAAEIGQGLRQAGVSAASLEGRGPFIAQFLPTGGVVVVNMSPYNANQLRPLAQSWITLAGQQALGQGAPPNQAHVTCNLLQGSGEACSLERLVLESTAGVLRERFPEAAIGIALGQRVLCALLRGGAQASWCGPGPA
ncbi:MAG: hypothetical protein Q7V15_02830 [Phenylobacterium sp.]|uniref:hypothetical protein n=1 Tax=Phenylobacterium sp. TaxID=1871053 RepID=UPI0027181758|nr:hypothetical protein [Phenylobacterium sp.]MDO8900267.1 hypothetical protein [Phenylobacterium sp.]